MKDFILGMCAATVIAGLSCGLVFGCKELGDPMPPVTATQVSDSPCAIACAHRKDIGCLEAGLEADCVPACVYSASHHWIDPYAIASSGRDQMAHLGIRCGR